jgi:cellulose synthase operon protein C
MKISGVWVGVAALALAWIAAGCSGATSEQMLASAKGAAARGEFRSAVIELKSALQQRPDWAEARFLLGKTLLDAEEPVTAVVELRKALEFKHPRDQVVPLLTMALVQQGQHKQAITEFGNTVLDTKPGQAALKTAIGWAHLGLGQQAQAEGAFAQALQQAPDHAPALVAKARLQAMNGDRDGALKTVEALASGDRGDADAWVLKGDLLSHQHADPAGAIAAYRQALKVNDSNLAAHGGIITLHLAQRDLKAAGEQVTQLAKVRPTHPVTQFFQAQLAFQSGNYKAAKEMVANLLKNAPDHPLVNQLAGSIEVASGSTEMARNYLNKTLVAAPSSVVARQLLGTSLLRNGEPQKALAVLEPLLSQAAPDPGVLALAGEAQMHLGDIEAASALFAKAVKAGPNAINQTALARARLIKGDVMGAVADLQQLAASDSGTVADIELINAQMRRRDFAAALTAIDALERKIPGKPLPHHLRGSVHLGAKDAAQARASFAKALSIDASYFPAVAALAALDLEDKKPLAAQQRIEAVLKAQPGHLRALLALARLRSSMGAKPGEVVELLADAVHHNPNRAVAHVALVEHLLATKQTERALSAAQRADAALAGDAAIVEVLGRTQAAAGQTNQAVATFNRLAGLRPDHALSHIRLAEANFAGRDTAAGTKSLERAVAISADPAAVMRLFGVHMQAKHPDKALALARDTQRRQADTSLGWLLEGDVLRARKEFDAALAVYRRGLTKQAPYPVATRVHAVLMDSGKRAEAAQFAQEWVKANPKDAMFSLYLGDSALTAGDHAAAETAYRRTLEMQPNNVVVLNNLAWLMATTGKPGALALAQKATSLQPNHPQLMSTLALALAADNQVDKALEVQKKAIELAPQNDVLRLGLARLYLQAGQTAQARDLLEPLAKLGDKFREHAQVKRLLAKL